MNLAILHLSATSESSAVRQSYLQATEHGVYHTHLNREAASTLGEFPPDVAVVEVGERSEEAFAAVEALLSVPRRRGDSLPLVLAELRPEDRERAARIAPHALSLPPGATPAEVESACLQAYQVLLG